MANEYILFVCSGPNRFELQAAVFDIEHPRLTKLTFSKRVGETEIRGTAQVWMSGAEQGNRGIEGWHIKGFFVPRGMKTPRGSMIQFGGEYSTHLRSGTIFTDGLPLVGQPNDPNNLIDWDGQ